MNTIQRWSKSHNDSVILKCHRTDSMHAETHLPTNSLTPQTAFETQCWIDGYPQTQSLVDGQPGRAAPPTLHRPKVGIHVMGTPPITLLHI